MSLAVAAMVFLSGFASLAYQVLWMRQLGFLFGNTAQAASVTLATFFAGLGAGSWWWGRRVGASARPMRLYAGLEFGIALAALAYFGVLHGFRALYPFVYESVSAETWLLFIKFGLAALLVFPASFFLGGTIPVIGQVMIRERSRFGRTASLFYGINTLGAALGVLGAAVIWIPSYGFGTSYVLALLLSLGLGVWAWKLSSNGSSMLNQSGDPLEDNTETPVERTPLLGRLALGAGISSILSRVAKRPILVNSSYALGSTVAFEEQANQSRIPLYLFPETRSIFFIGLGTGISAGAALDARFPNVERVVTCELTAAVVEASKQWVPPIMTGGVFTDERSVVRIEDGRHYLMASDKRFDMINADLFLPYRRGAGSLYSKNHYESVLESLNPEGVFVQWLPLYQLTDYEFGVISRTMLEVFGDVTMWRNNFVPGEEKVALIARRKAAPFPVTARGNGMPCWARSVACTGRRRCQTWCGLSVNRCRSFTPVICQQRASYLKHTL